MIRGKAEQNRGFIHFRTSPLTNLALAEGQSLISILRPKRGNWNPQNFVYRELSRNVAELEMQGSLVFATLDNSEFVAQATS